jgi:hypothetical protein
MASPELISAELLLRSPGPIQPTTIGLVVKHWGDPSFARTDRELRER